MKIVTIIGARPQFIKAATVSKMIRKNHKEIIVHTGQHYDKNMSEIFFKELNIPTPHYNLNVGSSSHAVQIGKIMIGVEEILCKEKPDSIIIYGDTNSTLAGALAAIKLNIPIIHIEAGLRSFNIAMPEEQNRILTDRIARLLFCPSDLACQNLKKEGIIDNVYNVGDIMCDSVLFYKKKIEKYPISFFFKRLTSLSGEYIDEIDSWYLVTIHRAENTRNPNQLKKILIALEQLNFPVIFPVHPRISQIINQLQIENNFTNIIYIQPVGYLEMLFLTSNACKVITDSGGLQKECYILKIPCITVREQTEWVETLAGGYNTLAMLDSEDILNKVLNTSLDTNKYKEVYGNGHAAQKISNIITKFAYNQKYS